MNHQKTLEDLKVPKELAAKCSEILDNDQHRPRTTQEQQLINEAHQIIRENSQK